MATIDFTQFLGAPPTDLPPKQQPAPTQDTNANPSMESQWDSFVRNNRAAMMSFGLQALSGGWGGLSQQFANATGKGLEAAGEQEALQARQQQAGAAKAERRSEKEKDRALAREEISSRERIAQMRNKPTSLSEQKQLRSLIEKRIKVLMTPQGIGEQALSFEEALPIAQRQAQEILENSRSIAGNLSSGNGSGAVPGGGSAGAGIGPSAGPGGAGNGPSGKSPYKEGDRKHNPKTGQVITLTRMPNGKLEWK